MFANSLACFCTRLCLSTSGSCRLSFRQWPEKRGSIPGRVIPKTQKMVFDAALLNTELYKVSSVKWKNPGKGVAPSPSPQRSRNGKESLWVTLFTYIYELACVTVGMYI